MARAAGRVLVVLALGGAAGGCGGSSAPPDGGSVDGGAVDAGMEVPDGAVALDVPATYAFESRFVPGASSVAYSGQAARGLLGLALRRFIDGLDMQIATGAYAPRDVNGDGTEDSMAQTVLADLDYFFGPDAAARADDPHRTPLPAGLSPQQATWGELSATAFLLEKLAGNDTSTDHRDWSMAFTGFSPTATRLFRGGSPSVSTPTGLVRAAFATVAASAQDAYDGADRLGPDGARLPVHLTADGLHLGEFTENFLLGALAFAQGADDYLDDDVDGKGLRSPNTRDGMNAYTTLEHAWDEGFGYFGAPRHVSALSAEALTASEVRAFDGDGDGSINFTSEYLFPTAHYAIERDVGSAASARTQFLADADLAFRTGRAIIAASGETLTDEEATALRAERDRVVGAWERTLAANAVSYLNAVVRWTLAIDAAPASYSFVEHAGEWSELKAFALAAQFHRGSPMLAMEGTVERFVTLHQRVGDAPVLSTATPAERAAYVASLLEARALLGRAYGFDSANLGADDGTGGW